MSNNIPFQAAQCNGDQSSNLMSKSVSFTTEKPDVGSLSEGMSEINCYLCYFC